MLNVNISPGGPEFHAIRTGLALYLHKLNDDEQVFNRIEEVDARTVLLDNVRAQRRDIAAALVALDRALYVQRS